MSQPDRHLTLVEPRRRTYPPRRPRNGHGPDCPYPKTDPQTCSVCASERKAADTA